MLLPLLAPGLVTAGLLAFIAAWNEYPLCPVVRARRPTNCTVPARDRELRTCRKTAPAQLRRLPWGQVMAATVIVTLPLIVAVLILQKRIIAGLTAGAVKG